MKGCLEGIRVLELGNFIFGPYGAMLLADMGAEVVKIENPQGGDPFRGWDLGGDQPNCATGKGRALARRWSGMRGDLVGGRMGSGRLKEWVDLGR